MREVQFVGVSTTGPGRGWGAGFRRAGWPWAGGVVGHPGAYRTGCGAYRTGCGAYRTGCGAYRTGCGAQQTGCGAQQTGYGAGRWFPRVPFASRASRAPPA